MTKTFFEKSGSMWDKLSILREQFINLGIKDSLDFEKFYLISIVYHSTKIEGCSLTETDTRVLLENNITAAGKPLNDHLMVKDHYQAFLTAKQFACEKRHFSIEMIREINASVMRSTGSIVNTVSGSFNTFIGDLRRAQVYVDKKYFPDFNKIPQMLHDFVHAVNQRIDHVSGNEIVKLSADVHYNFVNIHPFGDGNGRTARILMNYMQMYHNEPLIKIFTEDRAEYIEALNEAEEKQDLNVFRDFVCRQQIKFYEVEIGKMNMGKTGFSLLF